MGVRNYPRAEIYLIGGLSTTGSTLKTVDVLRIPENNTKPGAQLAVNALNVDDPEKIDFPSMNRRRHKHSSLVLGNKFLVVFFG